MAEFAKRMIPLNGSLVDQVFPVAKAVIASLAELRLVHRGDEDKLQYRRGYPTVTINNTELNILQVDFSMAGVTRSMTVWFDYSDHDDENATNNMFLLIGDWGLTELIFDTIEQALRGKFPEVLK